MADIKIAGKVLDAVECPFGCRIWPQSALAMHMVAHESFAARQLKQGGWLAHGKTPVKKANLSGRPRKADSEKIVNGASIKLKRAR